MPAGYPVAYRNPSQQPPAFGPQVGSPQSPPWFQEPANDNMPGGRPPWFSRPPRGPRVPFRGLGWVPNPLGAFVGLNASATLLQFAADELAAVFRSPETWGYQRTLFCGLRGNDTGGDPRWANTLANQCLGLQGYSIWSTFPVPAGVNGFTIIRPYTPFGPPNVDGYVYEAWNYPVGTAPGVPFGYWEPVYVPLADPSGRLGRPRFPRPGPTDVNWPGDKGYRPPGDPPIPREATPEPRTKNPRDKKAKGIPGFLQKMHHAATEGLDILDALWGALPKKYRTSPKCGNPGTAHSWSGLSNVSDPSRRTGGCFVTPQQKAKDLAKNWGHLDLAKAGRNLINNEIGDRFTGRLYGGASKATRRFTGGGFGGPLLNQGAPRPPSFDKNGNLNWEPFGSGGPSVHLGS